MNLHQASAHSTIASINPATGQMLREFEPHSDQELQRRLQGAVEAFHSFRKSSFEDRARLLLRVATLLETEKSELGRMMTLEMGKPLRAAEQEAQKCAKGCRYYAGNAARFLAQEPADAKNARSYVKYEPLGPLLAVMPWNFPFWQVFRFAAPALMAGNVCLL